MVQVIFIDNYCAFVYLRSGSWFGSVPRVQAAAALRHCVYSGCRNDFTFSLLPGVVAWALALLYWFGWAFHAVYVSALTLQE